MKTRNGLKRWVTAGVVLALCGGGAYTVQAKSLLRMNQVKSMRPADTLKVPAMPETASAMPPSEMPKPAMEQPSLQVGAASVPEFSGGSYDPSGRRDPFLPISQMVQQTEADSSLPPLQRIGLTELNLIGVVWGNYGYTAMVQTPDGKGYSIKRGTRIGPNNGVVSSITERGFIVQERFTDVYGNKQEREYVKLLHPKEGIE
ncbi:MAG: pilus assembly protein PilP [Nitrospiraceae bacterium]|nr:pilus assembly protein PilP [Nitrospiraceae bacterium]